MTQLERLKLRIPSPGEPDEAVLEDALESAKNIIIGLRYPYGDWPTVFVENENGEAEEVTVLEPRYLDLQVRMAEAIYLKRGGQYESSHSENGISRQWQSEGVPEALIREVVPYVGVIGG